MLQGGVSTGSPSREDRLRVEFNLFGIPLDADPELRPRYAYARGSTEGHRELNIHGHVVVRLDASVVPEATIVLGDSIGSTHVGEWGSTGPEPLAEPGLLCRYSEVDVCAAESLADACHDEFEFAEVQLFTRLEIEDIVELVFCGGEVADDPLRRQIRDRDLRMRELEGFLE